MVHLLRVRKGDLTGFLLGLVSIFGFRWHSKSFCASKILRRNGLGHFFATLTVELVADLCIVRQLLWDTNITATTVYVKVVDAMK